MIVLVEFKDLFYNLHIFINLPKLVNLTLEAFERKIIYLRKERSKNNKMDKQPSAVYELPADKYNEALALKIREMPEFKMPEWALYVKTSVSKLRPPVDNEWWYKRAASILRQIYINGIVGVGRLRVKYGSRKNRGMKPEIFAKASGKAIRTILQQAEKAGFLEKVKEGRRFGRRLTKSGKDLLEGVK